MYPLSNFIPSMVSSSSWRVLPSFTVITPFLPTFFIAVEMRLPTSWSPLADIVATYMKVHKAHLLVYPYYHYKEALTNLCNLLWSCDWFGQLLERIDSDTHGRHNSISHLMWVSSLGYQLKTIFSYRPKEGNQAV